jgi:hypothetical protein
MVMGLLKNPTPTASTARETDMRDLARRIVMTVTMADPELGRGEWARKL